MEREFCEVKENSGFSKLFQYAITEFLCITATKTVKHQKSFCSSSRNRDCMAILGLLKQKIPFLCEIKYFFFKRKLGKIPILSIRNAIFSGKKKKSKWVI